MKFVVCLIIVGIIIWFFTKPDPGPGPIPKPEINIGNVTIPPDIFVPQPPIVKIPPDYPPKNKPPTPKPPPDFPPAPGNRPPTPKIPPGYRHEK